MQQAERIGFIDVIAVAVRFNVKLVESTLVGSGNKSLPDAGIATALQQMAARAPRVEAADHRNQARVWRPDAEHHTGLAVPGDQVSAHSFVHAVVAALIEQVEILLGEQRLAFSGRDDYFWHFLSS